MTAKPTIPVFDIGNVLINWDPRHLYRKLFDDHGEMETFLETVCTDAWNLEQDRGRTFADAVEALTPQFPHYADHIRAYDERWPEMIPGAIEDSVALLTTLRAACPRVFAITNFNQDKFRLAQARFPFLTVFDDVVVSGDEKLLKPDPAIYQVLFDRQGVRPSDCAFVDDSEKNVLAARALGMHAIHFRTPQQAREEFRALGFAV
ncbi:MAG: 2-haloalkanoic acid dehalogenase [Rhizobiales bacterium 65-9]|nr:HAD family phosphatase [Hyphomicrobiales bacterium]OJY37358.1 MAG: 2-haloalkanoic acid dehalogenase [Rhizobiales bacterium 65-9]